MSRRARLDRSPHSVVSATLFASLFAAQSGVIAVSPVLAELARDLDVSTGVAGQLRTVTGLTAGITAVLLGRVARGVGPARQLLIASLLLAAGSLGSAAAPSFVLLALAQVPVGIAVGIYTTAGLLAAAEWVAPEHRTRVLSWALIGQPAAWIAGMPLVGALGDLSWRYGWLALPFVSALVAGAAVRRRRNEPSRRVTPAPLRRALAEPRVGRWLTGELFANTAWAGTLVYAGALIAETYHVSGRTTGAALAAGAAAYVAGNRLARRLPAIDVTRVLLAFALPLAATLVAFGSLRTSLGVSVALFSASGFLAGGRTLVSSAFGLSVPAELRGTVMGTRAATMQFGYFAGSIVGGAAVVAGGYPALGAILGSLFLAAAVVLVAPSPSRLRYRVDRVTADTLAGCGT
jgi:predicted MFS family arabinose efflux permease